MEGLISKGTQTLSCPTMGMKHPGGRLSIAKEFKRRFGVLAFPRAWPAHAGAALG